MAFTTHGYQIPGSPAEVLGPANRPCRGLSFCSDCVKEAAAWVTENEPKTDGFVGNESTTDRYFGLNRFKPTSIMRYFKYQHLPPHLMMVSKAYAELAMWTDDNIPEGPEKSTALRKLLEAKDAAVRAALDLF